MPETAAKQRVNRIALGRFERWALPRMARRLPRWVTPDLLTLVGLVAALGVGAAYALTHYGLGWLWAANLGLVLHWWGDSLDGTLARTRDICREQYGFYVDHQSDAVSAFFMFVGLGLSPLMPLPVALFLLVGYYLLMIHVGLVTVVRDVFKISFGGLGPTEGRLVLILANTAVFFLGNPTVTVAGQAWTLFAVLGVGGAAALLVYYVVFGLIERAELAVLDPPPQPGGDGRDDGRGYLAEEADEEEVPELAPLGSR